VQLVIEYYSLFFAINFEAFLEVYCIWADWLFGAITRHSHPEAGKKQEERKSKTHSLLRGSFYRVNDTTR
jgi:hypothetical protein